MLTAPRLIQDPARRHGYALAVALILLISAALRLWQLGTPAEMMFDEVYYAKDAKAIVDGRVGVHGQYRWAAGDEVHGRTRRWASSPSPPASCCSVTGRSAGASRR